MIEPRAIVVDLDGTLYNSSHREHLIHAKEYDAFHAASVDDEPHEDVLWLLEVVELSGAISHNFEIIALTGRNERYRAITFDWLREVGAPIDRLLMRPDGDFRPDAEVKPALLREYLGPENIHEKVAFILEDRDKMVEAWREEGFSCWQVRHGGY